MESTFRMKPLKQRHTYKPNETKVKKEKNIKKTNSLPKLSDNELNPILLLSLLATSGINGNNQSQRNTDQN